jgi:hypothetical protein
LNASGMPLPSSCALFCALLVVLWVMRFGLGPTFVFPTATSKSAGQGAWQAGPAVAAVYTGVPGLLAGFLLQNPISFAYTSADRGVSEHACAPAGPAPSSLGQLVFAIRGCKVGVWLASSFPKPLTAELGSRTSDGSSGLPPLNFYVSGQWTVYHQNSPVTSKWSVNFGVTIAFAQFREGQ